jgi:4'-phosphopantetheinyl transferase
MSQVHLWYWPIDRASEADWDLLDHSERDRARRFVHERHRTAFTCAHAGLRRILGRWIGALPASLAFEAGAGGKPRLAGRRGPHFNLSHSGGLAALGVSAGIDLGLDIERHRPIEAQALAAAFFAPGERQELSKRAEQDLHRAFFGIWTCKEAFVKALGLGLAMPLDAFAVSLDAGDQPRLVVLDGAPGEPDLWQFVSLDPAPHFSGAIAARAQGWAVVQEDARDASPPGAS